jgi:branched-chain amino acid transport system ATP-binding protein
MNAATVPTKVFQVQGLVKRFGGLLATDHVSLDIMSGEIHALIGPNGAGKTTLVNQLSGLLKPDAGRIVAGRRDLTPLPACTAAWRPACRAASRSRASFEPVHACATTWCMAVQSHSRLQPELSCRPRAQESMACATQPSELGTAGGAASTSSTALPAPCRMATQRTLDVALALAARPKLLLLDEPMAGMGPDESAAAWWR